MLCAQKKKGGILAKNKKLIKCIDCKNAILMRWFKNPIIAECKTTGERQVAEAKHFCDMHQKDHSVKEVKQFNSYEENSTTNG